LRRSIYAVAIVHLLLDSIVGLGMNRVKLYGQVRQAVYIEGLSRREAARRFRTDPADGGKAFCGAAWVSAEPAAGAAPAGSVC
jgi:hypothetical protein